MKTIKQNTKALDKCRDTISLGLAVSKEIYLFSCGLFEALEAKKVISGNGHHDAQRLALLAEWLIHKKSNLLEGNPGDIEEKMENFMLVDIELITTAPSTWKAFRAFLKRLFTGRKLK